MINKKPDNIYWTQGTLEKSSDKEWVRPTALATDLTPPPQPLAAPLTNPKPPPPLRGHMSPPIDPLGLELMSLKKPTHSSPAFAETDQFSTPRCRLTQAGQLPHKQSDEIATEEERGG